MQRIAALVLAPIVVLLIRRLVLKRRRGGLPLPPGPPGHLLWGNLEDLKQREHQPRWVTYNELSRQYGDVVYVEVFGDKIIILNSHDATTELLEKRSRNYSDRPPMHMANDLMGWGWDLVHMGYSDEWRIHRKTFHQYFQRRNVPEFRAVQEAAAKSLLQKLVTSPEGYYDHVKHLSGAIILKLVYGYTLQTENDPYMALAAKAMEGLRQVVNHGSFVVDYLPILKLLPSWFPGADFKRKAKAWAPSAEEVKEIPWQWMKKAKLDGTGLPAFASENLDKFPDDLKMEEVVKNCAAIAYLAGSDTTVAMILSFILAMTLYPAVQERAQAELDEKVGSSRLPDFGDREKLPFIEAVLAETLRWHPVVPLAIAHRSLHDDVYEGYFIPAGTTILPNSWAILHDEKLYGPDVAAFNPDRFLNKKFGEAPPPHPEQFAYGYGRRTCPGKYVADNSMWITIVYLLATFNIKKALDKDGTEVDPVVEYGDSVVSHPHPFECRFVPRSGEALNLIAA